MNSLSELLFGPPKVPSALPGDTPDASALPQPGGFARTLTDARAALPVTEEDPSSPPGVHPAAADPALSSAAAPAALSAMVAADGPGALRLAVRATTTAGAGQGSPGGNGLPPVGPDGGNGLPPVGPDGGKALPDSPPARMQPLPAAGVEGTSPTTQDAAVLARLQQERGSLLEPRRQGVQPGAPAAQAPGASASTAAALPSAMPEGLAERFSAQGQPGEVARQLGAVELRALDPTAQGLADARRPAGADLLNQGQPGWRQDIATQLDGTAVAAGIDRRIVAEAAGQRRGAEQQASAAAESVDRTSSTGAEAAEQISRPQTARAVVPMLAARDISAVAERIEMLMHRRSGLASVNLTLSELGDVEISVRLESKQAHVQFVVQDAAARESLEAQLPRLRALLSEGGLELGDIGMNMRERSDSDSGGERGDDRADTPRTAAADGGGVEEPSPRHRSGGGDHVLDAFA